MPFELRLGRILWTGKNDQNKDDSHRRSTILFEINRTQQLVGTEKRTPNSERSEV